MDVKILNEARLQSKGVENIEFENIIFKIKIWNEKKFLNN